MKIDKILEQMSVNSPVKDLMLNGNVNAISKSAMQEAAIQFAEWLKTAPKRKVIGSKGGIIHYHVFTMQELFEIFNNEE